MSKVTSITQARKDIYKLSEYVCNVHDEVLVFNASTGKNMVMISEEDWNAIKETLYLESIPGMVDSILEATKEPLSEGTIYNPEEEW
ncbi:MAG: type II toxin-antitoxin system Phd/YefM family antitoxin [Bacillota bacterium]|nr:type II toxin-antitoxin system Phd/YefM family antitoxin [Bacillota bacterium]